MPLATPLSGLSVLELGHSVAAPFAGAVLAQLGADVIKVETVEGDAARGWGPPFVGSHGVLFDTLNGGKKSAVVDLRDREQREALAAFIQARCDIVLQNLRPGVVERFHLAAADLRARKPSLIHCSISAFGAHGPLRDAPGYDPLMQAFAGMMSVTGEPGRPPVRVGPSIIDIGAGLWAVIGILAALADTRGPRGATIETSLYETALAWMSGYLAAFMASGDEPQRHGSGAPQIVPYQVFETTDGPLMVAAGNDRLFARLCEAAGLPGLADDPRYSTNAMRVENRETVVRLLSELMRGQDRRAWGRRWTAPAYPTPRSADWPTSLTAPKRARWASSSPSSR